MKGAGRQWKETAILAWRDFVHEWRVSLCLVFALSAVLAPLLVLFGLRTGIVTTMTERLQADPRNLELVIRGNHRFDQRWLDTLTARADVGFAVPRTRTLADGRFLHDIDLIPTTAGDPLLAGAPTPAGLHDVLVTHTAGAKLGVGPGSRVDGLITRRIDTRAEAVRVPLTVVAVLPETVIRGDAVFASTALLFATEDYRDGARVPELGADTGIGERPRERRFANVRLYARGLSDVAPLALQLRGEGLDVVTRAKEIASVQAIGRVLTLIFAVLAAIAAGGYLLSLAASVWATVERKRKEIALLRLIGLRSGPLIGFPVVQALLVAIGGIVVSGALYLIVATAFNRLFAAELAEREFVCRLFVGDALAAALLTVVLAIAAAVVGGYRATRIDPAERLREL
jgi:putative ABC transport system permease protein